MTDDLYKRYLSANSLETLTDEEQNWLEQHGAVRIGYLKNDVGISLVDTESEKPVGIINDYISLAIRLSGRTRHRISADRL